MSYKNMHFNIQQKKYLKTVSFWSYWVLSVAATVGTGGKSWQQVMTEKGEQNNKVRQRSGFF